MEAVTVVQVVVGGAVLALLVVRLWEAARPSLIESLERSMVSNQKRLDTQEDEIDDLRRQLMEVREGRLEDHQLLQVWIDYARRLGVMFREATGQEPPPEPVAPAPRQVVARKPSDTAALARLIAARFSLTEIDGLGFELGLDGVLTGETTEGRASSLVKAALRRDVMSQLLALCRRERPSAGF